jgi:hypothetical protein
MSNPEGSLNCGNCGRRLMVEPLPPSQPPSVAPVSPVVRGETKRYDDDANVLWKALGFIVEFIVDIIFS